MLKSTFFELCTTYSTDEQLIAQLWEEISKNHSAKNRHYHSLTHLENLLDQLNNVKQHITEWNTLLFTLFYHDCIYNARKGDNEEQSALLAEKRLTALKVPQASIDQCKTQILATKKHEFNTNSDTNYFTDADLSILGQSWKDYAAYAINVRKEYAIYPDLIYRPGRKKVLEHFLNMERIYKTESFFEQYELQAKENLHKELIGETV